MDKLWGGRFQGKKVNNGSMHSALRSPLIKKLAEQRYFR